MNNRSHLGAFNVTTAADITDAAVTAVVLAPGAGRRRTITDISVSNLHPSQSTRVDILSGSTIVYQGPAAAGGGGYSASLVTPIECAENEAISAQCGTSGAQVQVTIGGFLT